MATTGTETGVLEDRSLRSKIEDKIVEAIVDLRERMKRRDRVGVELQEKFSGALADIETVRISQLPDAYGAFRVKDGQLQLDEEPLSRLCATVLDEVRTAGFIASSPLEIDLLDLFVEMAIVYALHEVRHRTQGVENYSDVQNMKLIAGPGAMAEFDIYADRDAAFAYAAIRSAIDNRLEFLEAYQQALFFSSSYFFEVFGIPENRPDKIARAMSVFFMAARVAPEQISEPIEEAAELPFDATLIVRVSTPVHQLAIYRGEPSLRLLTFANDPDIVRELSKNIVTGRFQRALELAMLLLRKVGLLPADG